MLLLHSADADTSACNPDNVHIIFLFSNSSWHFAYVHFENTSRSEGKVFSCCILTPLTWGHLETGRPPPTGQDYTGDSQGWVHVNLRKSREGASHLPGTLPKSCTQLCIIHLLPVRRAPGCARSEPRPPGALGNQMRNTEGHRVRAEAWGAVSSRALTSAASLPCFKGLDWVPHRPPAGSYL